MHVSEIYCINEKRIKLIKNIYTRGNMLVVMTCKISKISQLSKCFRLAAFTFFCSITKKRQTLLLQPALNF
jgi:hypothetical protein